MSASLDMPREPRPFRFAWKIIGRGGGVMIGWGEVIIGRGGGMMIGWGEVIIGGGDVGMIIGWVG